MNQSVDNFATDSVEGEDTIVVKHQNEIKVFENGGGGITIESADAYGEIDRIAFNTEHANAICNAIRLIKKEIESGRDK